MLHDPARHEALRPIAWDEARVRATIARIVDETVAAFSPETLWPVHPRDLEAGDHPDAPVTHLYCGAIGVAWALDYLNAVGAFCAATALMFLALLTLLFMTLLNRLRPDRSQEVAA